jgi:non-specific serine/threonine protein kinase
MIGQFVAHYKILEKIGEGGMGVVYKTEDTKLKRIVALKFLPPELTRDPQAKKRFLQEAQAAAALDHPNICTIHEINEFEGQMFIVMAYIKGPSLKERIAHGPIKVAEALDISTQVAEGLWAAHEKGIIHRDIKPANIMLPEKGPAKIMDFGLAKLAWAADLTKTVGTMGTLGYMSPEQARGDAVDHRTDIWSLGVVLYEILAGQLPFIGEEMQGIVYSILNKEPAPLTSIRPDIPRLIVQVVTKALEKDPSRRYQNIQELIQDLKAPAPFIFPKPEKSIIVLPFENMSPDPEQEYFSDGLTEEIITDLSQVHDLLVISRSSAMTFKGTKKTIPEIARAVNVRYVLEGSVRKAGNNLRITAQLIDSSTDAHLWAEKYAGTLDDIFDIQEKVSRSIVDALRLTLTPDEKRRITERPINNPLAYEYYLKARQEILKFTEEGINRALQHLQHGLDIVGENALLLAGMGYAYYQYVNAGLKNDASYLRRAEQYAKRVFELDPDSPYGHLVLGLLKIWWKDSREGIRHLKRVLAVNSDDFDALYWLSAVYAMIGKKEAAEPLTERLMKIDPLNPAVHFYPGWIQWWDGHFDSALESFRKSYQTFPEDFLARLSYTMTLILNHRYDEAWSILSRLTKDMPGYPLVELWLKFKSAIKGQKSKVLQWKSSEFKIWAWRDFALSYYVAQCYSLIDEKKDALGWLEHSIDLGMINYPYMNEYDPFFENIRGEERFQKLMERVKYEWEHFEE